MLNGTSATMLTQDERDWIVAGMAWVGMRRWMCGAADAERAQVWFHSQIAARFSPSYHHWTGPGPRPPLRHIMPDMERLLCEMQAGLGLPPEIVYPFGAE